MEILVNKLEEGLSSSKIFGIWIRVVKGVYLEKREWK